MPIPVEANAELLLAFNYLPANHAFVWHRGCVTARVRSGKRKAGDFIATSKAWQVVLFLFLCAIVQQ
jgi:hypothetical protein